VRSALPLLPLLPLLAAVAVGMARARLERLAPRARRRLLGGFAFAVMALLGAALAAALAGGEAAAFAWGGPLTLSLRVVPEVAVAAGLVPTVATPVLLWAAGHEELEGLPRLIAGLLAFVGTMELLVLADDLLTLTVGWELVGGVSFALIAHHHRDPGATASAAYAYNATRAGGLGLLVAAGASIAATGSFAFDALPLAADTPWGHWLAAGVLVAAASKSAQVPFSPWLLRAMAGPSSVSALLHSSTMVAAGAWILVRLSEPLLAVPWFGPAAIALGLTTAVGGGVAASLQPEAKRLLAASTSAHYGLMFVAAGAGAAGAALAHLAMHALFKALLFLVAGAAKTAAGGDRLAAMRLGRALPAAAAASLVASLALAGVPPLGGAWSKERVIAGAGHASSALAVATLLAGALSAFYAARFHLLAFGRPGRRRAPGAVGGAAGGERRSRPLERLAYLWLGVLVVASSALFWPGARPALARWSGLPIPSGHLWELALSFGAVAALIGVALGLDRGGALASLARPRAAEWLGLPSLIRAGVTRPALATATACARFDARVVDAGVALAAATGRLFSRVTGRLVEGAVDNFVRGVAAATTRAALQSRMADDAAIDGAVTRVAHRVGALGRAARRLQSGAVPTYYALVVAGLAAAVALLALFGR
jgi:NADH:ubiquinone oxidoreductase subunit 5 (subunit L)/multisubunit Na+/H+ antiporter MnhA subunit